MAIRPILEMPHPLLRQVAKPVAAVDDRIRTLLDDMAETMYAAPGIGLAAPQVGVSERVIVAAVPVRDGLSEEIEEDEDADHKSFLTELVNPVIVEADGRYVCEEGCLSVPEVLVEVPRADRIVVEALDRAGQPLRFEARGFYAVVFQHEIDHLDGKTLYDRLSGLKRTMYTKKRSKAKKDGARSPASAP
jgi:peptide deformylase